MSTPVGLPNNIINTLTATVVTTTFTQVTSFNTDGFALAGVQIQSSAACVAELRSNDGVPVAQFAVQSSDTQAPVDVPLYSPSYTLFARSIAGTCNVQATILLRGD